MKINTWNILSLLFCSDKMWKSEVVSKDRGKKCKKNQSLIKANGRGTNENTNVFMSRQKNKTNVFVKLKWTPKHKNTEWKTYGDFTPTDSTTMLSLLWPYLPITIEKRACERDQLIQWFLGRDLLDRVSISLTKLFFLSQTPSACSVKSY